MRKKASKNKNSRSANTVEKEFVAFICARGCCVCGSLPVSPHHCVGSTYSHNRQHIGHAFQIPLCHEHHQGSLGIHAPHVGRIAWVQRYGKESEFWAPLADEFGKFTNDEFDAVMRCGK